MSLQMSGLDCHRAGVSLRERLAFSREQIAKLLDWLKSQPALRS